MIVASTAGIACGSTRAFVATVLVNSYFANSLSGEINLLSLFAGMAAISGFAWTAACCSALRYASQDPLETIRKTAM
jgi:hypothetical protein